MKRATMHDAEDFVESNQRQATAAWIQYLNRVRIERLAASLAHQDVVLDKALASVKEALAIIGRDVVDTRRGGQKGMHGFIAEVAETGIGNARAHLQGQAAPYQWVNDNGPADLLRHGTPIQQKFVTSGGRFGLGAISEHLRKYPDFIKNGGKYQIPLDHFEAINRLRGMSAQEAGKLAGHQAGELSFRDWIRVRAFFDGGAVPFDSLEPSTLEYSQVQRGTYKATLGSESASLRETDRVLRGAAHRQSRPSTQEALKVAATAAAIEGATAWAVAVVAVMRQGKKLRDFTSDDWRLVASKTSLGTATGGIRGLSVYFLTNYTATPAAAASSIVTAALGIAGQAYKLRCGEINEEQFIARAEMVALDAAISTLSSFVGQSVIPVPVLGAVLGNTVGQIIYRSAASSLSRRESELLARYLTEQRMVDERLAAEYGELIDELAAEIASYVDLLDQAFSPDLPAALDASVELALTLGVSAEELLDSPERARSYFMD